jgi:hypothetical protein
MAPIMKLTVFWVVMTRSLVAGIFVLLCDKSCRFRSGN